MAMEDGIGQGCRSQPRSTSRATSDMSDDKCFCTKLQFRAFLLICFSGVVLFVSQIWSVASYMFLFGCFGFFIGIILIVFDMCMYLQRGQQQRRLATDNGLRDPERDAAAIWTTSTTNSRRLSFDDKPPDYDTTVNQPEMFPLPPFLQDGVPSSVTPLAMDSNTSSSEDEKDRLPTYDEIVSGRPDTQTQITWNTPN